VAHDDERVFTCLYGHTSYQIEGRVPNMLAVDLETHVEANIALHPFRSGCWTEWGAVRMNMTRVNPSSARRKRRRLIFAGLLSFTFTQLTFLGVVGALSLSAPDAQQNRLHLQKNKELLILGLGRVGLEVANQASETNCFGAITGTVRSNTESLLKDDLVDADCRIRRVPFHEIDTILQTARSCTHLLVTVPPPPESNESKETTRLLDQVFDSVTEMLPNDDNSWIGIISTTGVYGNHNGAWVTEESPCLAVKSGTSARRYIDYEMEWANRAQRNNQRRLCIFRCAGIYGPKQSALHTVFKNGSQSVNTNVASAAKGSDDVTNRIHVVDLAAAVVASMMQAVHPPSPSTDSSSHACTIYNLSDDLPASRTEVMGHATDLLQSVGATIPEPQKTTSPTSSRARRRQTDQKRVRNKRMKDLLDDNPLKYPTYREGLAAILQDRTNPWWHQQLGL